MYTLDYPWLLALLPAPLLVWWLLPPYREQTPAIRVPFFEDITKAAGIDATEGSVVPRANLMQKIIAPVCWALVLLALARPQFIEPPIEKTEPQRDLMLALDLSQSMDTKDFRDPTGNIQPRVDAVKVVVADFVEKRPNDRLGLIAFGDAPYPLVPFTMDHGTIRTMLAETLPGMAGPRTALGDAIGLSIKLFDQSQAPDKVLIILTDGNDTASKMAPGKAAEIAKDNHIVVHTVGIGDPDATGENKLDPATLEKIARTTGGRTFFGSDQNALAEIYALLDRITPANQKTLSWQPRRELFYYPLGGAIALLLTYHLLMWIVSAVAAGGTDREAEA